MPQPVESSKILIGKPLNRGAGRSSSLHSILWTSFSANTSSTSEGTVSAVGDRERLIKELLMSAQEGNHISITMNLGSNFELLCFLELIVSRKCVLCWLSHDYSTEVISKLRREIRYSAIRSLPLAWSRWFCRFLTNEAHDRNSYFKIWWLV